MLVVIEVSPRFFAIPTMTMEDPAYLQGTLPVPADGIHAFAPPDVDHSRHQGSPVQNKCGAFA